MKIIFLLITLLLLFSCTPQQRLNRLVHNHPELITTDTLRDTTIIEGWHYDTIAKLGETDTVIVQKEGTTVTIYKWNTDSIFVEVEAEPDTIEVSVPCPQVIVQEKNKEYGWYIRVGLLLLFICIILYVFRKLFN